MEIERNRVYQLSDRELLEVIRGRGRGLQVALELAKLVRVFEEGGKGREALKPGLDLAIGLTKLWSQNFAPGHPEHPFRDFELQVGDLVRMAEEGRKGGGVVVEEKKRKQYTPKDGRNRAREALGMALLEKGEFSVGEVLEKHPGLERKNLANGINVGVKEGKLERVRLGVYRVLGPPFDYQKVG